MSDIIKTYAQVVADTVAQIAGETEAIDKAAQLVADAIKRDELVHVIGPGGHSNMAVEEVLWRAGGLAPVDTRRRNERHPRSKAQQYHRALPGIRDTRTRRIWH